MYVAVGPEGAVVTTNNGVIPINSENVVISRAPLSSEDPAVSVHTLPDDQQPVVAANPADQLAMAIIIGLAVNAFMHFFRKGNG